MKLVHADEPARVLMHFCNAERVRYGFLGS